MKMKKHILRFSVTFLTFLIGLTALYFVARIRKAALDPSKAAHSAENNSPYSILEGTTIRIKPYNATFEIPEDWLTRNPVPAPSKNLYLSYQDLNELYWNDGSDAEEAQVINSVLSISDCAAHFGDKGWGNDLWNDLQGRVYITNLSPEEVASRVDKQGLDCASNLFEHASAVASGRHDKWVKSTLDVLDAPSWSDFSLGRNLDFYYRSFGSKTVVFVFLHTDTFEKEINLLLDSFKWATGTLSAIEVRPKRWEPTRW